MSTDDPGLKPRQELILRTVVEEHIASGQPVGSKHIAGREGLDFASSTVRYELARLEELGFLDHPHTSAGRGPTDRGYRYYVDTLLTRDPPARPPAMVETALDLTQVQREVDEALSRLADVVAQVTNLLGIVTAPAPMSSTVKHVEVLPLQPQVVMVVVITSTGAVTKRVFAFDRAIDHGLCEWAGAFLNDRLVGAAVGTRTIESRLDDPSLSPRERAFLDVLSPAVVDLEGEGSASIFVGGRARFLAEQRHLDLIAIDALMESLEERYQLLAMLRGALGRNQVYLRIGSELADRSLSGLSMVAANYGVARRNLGTVSLFGPTRMDYRLAMATVRGAAQILSRYVEDVYDE
ncbi:MAG TPA: heat-inducible transcriptional repressor HrcA [Miltoncostaeaceae bacterium]|nr:heat-inducible transcriptional repressor HrcA [Miltoncostaeaceae bacterium]